MLEQWISHGRREVGHLAGDWQGQGCRLYGRGGSGLLLLLLLLLLVAALEGKPGLPVLFQKLCKDLGRQGVVQLQPG